MTYSISISGMHCTGCQNLITMSLDDAGFSNVTVDSEAGTAAFTSDKAQGEVEALLTSAFAEFDDYSYSNLRVQ